MAAERVILPNSVVPTHYALELHPDLDPSKLEFLSNLQISVNVVNSVSEVTLHSKEITISSVSFSSNAAGGKMLLLQLESFQ